jgi:ParB/Sulfiredoxin domain/MT-A70
MSAAVAISSITIGDRHRRDMGDLRVLANSIAEVGLLQPIGMSPSGELVFGERRLRACRDILCWCEIPARVVNVRSIVEGVTLTNQSTVLFAPAPENRHSRKPDAFYELVESLCPGSKVELFCRHPRCGWAAHGDEARCAA